MTRRKYGFDRGEEEGRDGNTPRFHAQKVPIQDSLFTSCEGFLKIRRRDRRGDTNLGVLGAPRCQSSKSFAFTVSRRVCIDRVCTQTPRSM